jgi:hypothetical protein
MSKGSTDVYEDRSALTKAYPPNYPKILRRYFYTQDTQCKRDFPGEKRDNFGVNISGMDLSKSFFS